MPEIRNEAHIKCKVLSNALIAPGVRAMIEEPVPVNYVFVRGETIVELGESSGRKITFNCGFVPRIVYLIGYTSDSWSTKYTNYTISYTRYTTVAYVCNLAKLKILGQVTYYQTSKQSNSSTKSHSNNTIPVNSDFTFDVNEDGSITIYIPNTGTYASYIKEGGKLTFYAGYTNESREAYDAGYDEGYAAGYQAGYEEGKMKNAVLGTAVLNQMVLV